MAKTRLVEAVIQIVAVITKEGDDAVFDWAIERLRDQWGAIAEIAPPAPFVAGGFYTPQMGQPLRKTLVAFEAPTDPEPLAKWKSQSNQWEFEAAQRFGNDGSPRPLNLDPGYVTQAKWVLATVKDRDHRIYLRDGIFAEVTLNYVGGQWVHHRWTYPDYRTAAVADFASRCRQRLRDHLGRTGQFRTVRPG